MYMCDTYQWVCALFQALYCTQGIYQQTRQKKQSGLMELLFREISRFRIIYVEVTELKEMILGQNHLLLKVKRVTMISKHEEL